MKNVKMVIGANYGDEGKGLMTDYMCRKFQSPVVNIRHSGGSQAGHTVVTPEGKRHIFSHFGSGSFNDNVSTYLSSYFVVNPITFVKEYRALDTLGVKPIVYLCKQSYITLPQDMIINQLYEKSKNQHCSCGLGIYETIYRNSNGFKLCIKDIQNKNRTDLIKLICASLPYFKQRLLDLHISGVDKELEDIMFDTNLIEQFVCDTQFMLSVCKIMRNDNEIFDYFDNIVFEGSQGLCLSVDNIMHFPYLTSTHTGIKNAVQMLEDYGKKSDMSIEICYVTRPYFTRHGDGYLDFECDRYDILPISAFENTNFYNVNQGKFRYGYFDLSSFLYEINYDLTFADMCDIDYVISVAITHLDQTNGQIKYHGISPTDCELTHCNLYSESANYGKKQGIKYIYESYGCTCNDIRQTDNTLKYYIRY